MSSELQRKLESAVSEVLNEYEPSVITRWVMMIEVIDADGSRGLWSFAHNNATPWDTCGLLQYGLQREQTRIMRSEEVQ